MFVVKRDNEELAYLEHPIWIKRLNNGCFGLADRERATGIALPDGPVSLGVSEDMSELPIVTAQEVDGGALLAQYAANLTYLSAMTGIDFPADEAHEEDGADE